MALYRQRAHDRRVHELSLQNQDLRKDVDKLEDALELHKRLKHKDETSVKGIIRKEIGGPIWQHGGEGKLHTYKSTKDLEVERQRSSKKKIQSEKQGQQINLDLEPKVGKVTSRGKNLIKGGASVGTKSKHYRPSSVTGAKSNKDKENVGLKDKELFSAGATYNIQSKRTEDSTDSLKTTYELSDHKRELSDHKKKPTSDLNHHNTKLGQTFAIKGRANEHNGELLHMSENGSSHKTETRIEVLNKMINKLRDSWQLDETHENFQSENSASHKPDPLVIEWLKSLNLKQVDKYVDIFTKNEIDLESLKMLNETRLKKMGITAVGSLAKIQQGIENVKNGSYKFSLKQDIHATSSKSTSSKFSAFDEQKNKRKNILGKDISSHKIKGDSQSTKSLLTTKMGKNTFNPKELLQELQTSESDEDDGAISPTNKSGSKSKVEQCSASTRRLSNKSSCVLDSKTIVLKPRGEVPVINSIANRTKAKSSRPGTAPPSSRRGLPRTPSTQKVASKTFVKGTGAKSSAKQKDNESEYGDLDDLVSIRTVIQDVSADETEDDFTPLVEDQVEETKTEEQGHIDTPVVIPQVENVLESDADVDEDETLKGIEHEIVSLADNIARPGAIDRITKLQEQLKGIQKQIEMKKKQNEEIGDVKETVDVKEHVEVKEYGDESSSLTTKFDEQDITIPPLDITGRSVYNLGIPDNAGKEEVQEKPLESNPSKHEEIDDVLKTDNKSKVSSNNKVTSTRTGVVSRNMSKGELLREVRKQKDQHRKQIRHLESELSRLKHKDPLRSCEVAENELHFIEQDLIGEGAFSQVFHGTYQGSEVAVKRLKIPLTAQDKNYFMAEVNLLKDLRHPRVVLLMGVCTTSKLPLMVLEFLANGSLYTYLHNPQNESLDHAAYYQIARDTALGMNYLHLHKPAVLHLDLKSMNVLLSLQLRAKIADFGFSKLRHDADMKAKEKKLQPGSRGGQVKGTPAWLAPEMLDFKQVTTKSDVYSFGVILWEMLTRRHPYQGCSIFQIIERVRTNKRPEMPSECSSQLATLIRKCWDKNPAKRPQFKDILSTLEELHLPCEWKQLFTSAGVPHSTLDDINATRTLISLVNETLEKVERPSDVPMLELYDSDNEDKPKFIFPDSSDDDDLYEEGVTAGHLNQEPDEDLYTKKPELNEPSHTLEDQVAFYDTLANVLHSMDKEPANMCNKEDDEHYTLNTETHRIDEDLEAYKASKVHRGDEFVSQLTEKLNQHLQSMEEPSLAKSNTEFDKQADSPSDRRVFSTRKSLPCADGYEKVKLESSSKSLIISECKNDDDDDDSVVPHSDSVKSPSSWEEDMSMFKALPNPSVKTTTTNKNDLKSSSSGFQNVPPPPPFPPPSLNKIRSSNIKNKMNDSKQIKNDGYKKHGDIKSQLKQRKEPMEKLTQSGIAKSSTSILQYGKKNEKAENGKKLDTKSQDVNVVDLRASQLIAKRNQLKPSVSTDPSYAIKSDKARPKLPSIANIRASQLVKQRGQLRSTDVPHPKQLPDLSQVEERQLCDLAEILKKAVDQRRMVISETNTLDSVGTTSWDLTDD